MQYSNSGSLQLRSQISNMDSKDDLNGTYFEKIIMSPKLKFRRNVRGLLTSKKSPNKPKKFLEPLKDLNQKEVFIQKNLTN